MNQSDIRMRQNLCRRLSAARRRQKYEPGLTRTAVDRVVKNLRLPVKGPTRGVTASQQKPRQSQTARAERRPPRAQEVEDEGWQKVRRRSHRTSTPPRGNTQCYFCGESGHVKDSCRHGHRVECNTCGGLGHKAKFCTR